MVLRYLSGSVRVRDMVRYSCLLLLLFRMHFVVVVEFDRLYYSFRFDFPHVLFVFFVVVEFDSLYYLFRFDFPSCCVLLLPSSYSIIGCIIISIIIHHPS